MDDRQLGQVVRSIRHRRNWRQSDLAEKVAVSAGVIGLVERGRADLIGLRKLRALCHALGIRLEWDVGWRGPELHRMRDADHAWLANHWKRWLELHGYLVQAEVSFNRYGDRGRMDLLAFEPRSRSLLVIEIKSVLVDSQELLGSLDMKTRIARGVASGLGWAAAEVVPVVLLADGTTNRRRLADHAALFSRYSLRGRTAIAWLGAPHRGVDGALVLSKLPNRKHADARRAGRQRVRPIRPISSTNSHPSNADGADLRA